MPAKSNPRCRVIKVKRKLAKGMTIYPRRKVCFNPESRVEKYKNTILNYLPVHTSYPSDDLFYSVMKYIKKNASKIKTMNDIRIFNDSIENLIKELKYMNQVVARAVRNEDD